MKIEEAYEFYKNQFNMFKDRVNLLAPDISLAEEIIEQIGKPFQTVLELGAGAGLLARGLATFDKEITTVDLVKELVDFAKSLNGSEITALCGDFYEIDISQTFDVILYMDGFGVGEDTDQLLLLRRMHDWLKDDGVALIDIYQPRYWQSISGQEMKPIGDANVQRIYGYDERQNRMTDTWWQTDYPKDKSTQSLACYTPDEIYALCKQANLEIIAYFPGGAMDFQQWQYHELTSLNECLSYRIKVKKKS